MGTDPVELVMVMEAEFGVTFDEDAKEFGTVGETYDYLRNVLRSTPPSSCLSQKMFYKLRNAVVKRFGVPRDSISPAMKLSDVLPAAEISEGWPYIEVLAGLKTPEVLKDEWHNFVAGVNEDSLTMRELVTAMMSLNADKMPPVLGTDEEIWVHLVAIILRQTTVTVAEIRPEASYRGDLGVS